MTGSETGNMPLDIRKRRLAFRAWHRGIRELDLIFGQYVEVHVEKMNETAVAELEYIMSFEDRDLLTWVTGEIETPRDIDTPLFRDILDYRNRMEFY